MPMQAKRGRPTGPSVSRETEPVDDMDDGHPDELIMVMFPRITYNAIVELTEESGSGSVARTMSLALALLKEKIDKHNAAG